ncbi:MAG: PilZ domain-containing protein [Gammaproteobacteria bacterium]|nr:PilZ domain-containing protein [Gammaproteobacteria bacterium]
MHDFAEKRDFIRMPIDCPAQFRIAGSDSTQSAIVKNLSSNGMLMLFDREIDPGTQLTVEIMPGKNITPPLSAEMSVLRSYTADEGNFNIACAIERILSEEEVGPDFP